MELSMVGLLLVLGIGQGQSASNVHSLAAENSQLKGLVFTSHLLFDVQVRCVGACALTCLQTGGCASFTFTPQPPSSSSVSSGKGACRGHSTVMTADDDSVLWPGSTLFVSGNNPWLHCTFSFCLCRTRAELYCLNVNVYLCVCVCV